MQDIRNFAIRFNRAKQKWFITTHGLEHNSLSGLLATYVKDKIPLPLAKNTKPNRISTVETATALQQTTSHTTRTMSLPPSQTSPKHPLPSPPPAPVVGRPPCQPVPPPRKRRNGSSKYVQDTAPQNVLPLPQRPSGFLILVKPVMDNVE